MGKVMGNISLLRRKAPSFPDGEATAVSFSCPTEYCRSSVLIGGSKFKRPGKRRGSGCVAECACPHCGSRLHVVISGKLDITVKVIDNDALNK